MAVPRAEEVVAQLTAADPDAALRQLGVVDRAGGAATFTGEGCHAWAGGITGAGYAVQGNILVSEETVDSHAARRSSHRPAGRSPSGCLPVSSRRRPPAATAAVGSRPRLLVVERDGGYGGLCDTLVDLRVDDHADPVPSCERLYAIHSPSSARHRARSG